jgi:hypothetical protein
VLADHTGPLKISNAASGTEAITLRELSPLERVEQGVVGTVELVGTATTIAGLPGAIRGGAGVGAASRAPTSPFAAAPTVGGVLDDAVRIVDDVALKPPAPASAAPVATAKAPPTAADVAPASNAPQIPAGSKGGQGAGQRIPQSLRDQHFPEGQTRPPCAYCRQNPCTDLDHVLPRSQGGDLTPQNITPACKHCNTSKGAREAPKTPPSNYQGDWPPAWWPQWMKDAWQQRYGG